MTAPRVDATRIRDHVLRLGEKHPPIDLATVDLTVKGGALNRVYALGDPEKNTMNVAVHVIATGSSGSARPTKVNTGTGGEAAGATRFLAKLTR